MSKPWNPTGEGYVVELGDWAKLEFPAMPAFIQDFWSLVQESLRFVGEDFELLTQAEVASPGATLVGFWLLDNFPLDWVLGVGKFQAPHVFGESGALWTTLILMCEVRLVAGEACLERRLRQANILLDIHTAWYSCSVDNSALQALVFYRAGGLVSAVAGSLVRASGSGSGW